MPDVICRHILSFVRRDKSGIPDQEQQRAIRTKGMGDIALQPVTAFAWADDQGSGPEKEDFEMPGGVAMRCSS